MSNKVTRTTFDQIKQEYAIHVPDNKRKDKDILEMMGFYDVYKHFSEKQRKRLVYLILRK